MHEVDFFVLALLAASIAAGLFGAIAGRVVDGVRCLTRRGRRPSDRKQVERAGMVRVWLEVCRLKSAGAFLRRRPVKPAGVAVLKSWQGLLRFRRPIDAHLYGRAGRPTDCPRRCTFPVMRTSDETGRDAGKGVIDRHGQAPP
jgi:hypothetical protein